MGHILINLEITGICLHGLSCFSLISGLHNIVCGLWIDLVNVIVNDFKQFFKQFRAVGSMTCAPP